jgi:hypothetical protein
MLVSMPRRRGFGDAVDDILAGKDGDGLVSNPVPVASDSLLTPTWASSATSAPPPTPTQGNNPQSWTTVGQNLVLGIFGGLTKPTTPVKPLMLGTSSSSTVPLLIGGVAVVGLVALLMRRRSSEA